MRSLKRLPIPNALLSALPRKSYEILLPVLEPITLDFGEVLYEPGGLIRSVYFPNDSLVSLLTLVEGRRATEVGLVGREGLVGLPAALGLNTSSLRAVVQGTGSAMRMNVKAFRGAFIAHPTLRRGILRFTHALMAQVTQTAGCNRFHLVGQRLARWLLMTQDRLQRAEFRLTHEFLAQILGVRRVGVTQAASSLQKRKLISYTRGTITILDRAGLAASTCTCYEAVNRIYSGR